MKKFGKSALCIASCVIILSQPFAAYSASGEVNSPKVLKAGFFEFDGYHEMNENGVKSGYGYDVLQHLASYGNWTYDYVGYDKSWADMQQMLENGEIDFVTSARKTDERMEHFDFCSEPIGESLGILTVKSGSIKYFPDDFENWDGMRVGMIYGNSRNDDFEEYAKEKGFTYQKVMFDDIDKMTSELKSDGSIDAIVTSNLRDTENERIIAQFNPTPFYIIVKKGNEELLNELDAANSALTSNEAGLFRELRDKYYSAKSKDDILYSREEYEYIQSMKSQTIKAYVNPDRVPVSYIENGETKGIIPDIAKKIGELTGLEIEIVYSTDREEYYNAIDNKQADIILDAVYDYAEAEGTGYKLTQPYYNADISLLKRSDFYGTPKKIAAIYDKGHSDKYVISHYDESQITYYNSKEEAIEAVLQREQDALFLFTDTAERAVYDEITGHLITEHVFSYSVDFSIGVCNTQDIRLVSVLNKAVMNLDDGEIEKIAEENCVYPKKEFSIIGFTYSNPTVIMTGMISLFVITILGVLLIVARSRRKEEHERMALEKKKNEVLSEALQAAKQAAKSKGVFLSRVSHEMRTPLNAILGYISLAESEKDIDVASLKEYLEKSKSASRQLLSVIDEVLEASTLESGRAELICDPFDLKKVLFEQGNIFFGQAKAKKVNFEIIPVGITEEKLVGDVKRLEHILSNLLSNAVKFTHSGGDVTLIVTQLSKSDNNVFLRFEVEDTGIGMEEEFLDRIFLPFEQESGSIGTKYGGTGLGLSIVHMLTIMMNGTIRVSSHKNVGTMFTLDIPFTVDILADDENSVAYGDISILVADDELFSRKYISTLLDKCGVTYSFAISEKEMLSELARAFEAGTPYKLCLVDEKMQGAIDAVKKVKTKYNGELSVVIISGLDNPSSESRCANVDMIISKPLFYSTIYEMLVKLYGGKVLTDEKNSSPDFDFSGYRLLVAEDNSMNMEIAKKILEKVGATVEEAENGRIAADKYCENEPYYYDAVLMDIQMPEMNGYESMEAIRSSGRDDAKSIPIIALTANAFADDITSSIAAGMNGHISKPIDYNMLFITLKKLLDENKR